MELSQQTIDSPLTDHNAKNHNHIVPKLSAGKLYACKDILLFVRKINRVFHHMKDVF